MEDLERDEPDGRGNELGGSNVAFDSHEPPCSSHSTSRLTSIGMLSLLPGYKLFRIYLTPWEACIRHGPSHTRRSSEIKNQTPEILASQAGNRATITRAEEPGGYHLCRIDCRTLSQPSPLIATR